MWAWLSLAILAAAPTGELVVTQSVGEQPPSDEVLVKLTTLTEEALQQQRGPDRSAEQSAAAKTIKLARLHYFDLKFAASEGAAAAALQYLQSHPDEPSATQLAIDAHLIAALAQLELGQAQKAQVNLLAALTYRPTLVLSESEYAPTALAALERARDKVAALPRASLTVASTPPFAKVTLDGNPAGETPVTLRDIIAGRHSLVLQAPGRVPKASWVDVPPEGLKLSYPLDEDPTLKLRASLNAAVAAGGQADVLAALKELAKASGGPAALLAVATRGEHYAVTLSRVWPEGTSARAGAVLERALSSAPADLEALVKAVAVPRPSPTVLSDAPLEAGFEFDKYFVGLKPEPPKPVELPPAPPPVPAYKRPLLWVVVVGVVAAAGGGVGIYFATRRQGPEPGLMVTVVPPP